MSKTLYYTYLIISILSLVSTIINAIWWEHESFRNSNRYTPVEPVLFTLISFVIMVYFINKLFLFID
jgi:hypothetical protein